MNSQNLAKMELINAFKPLEMLTSKLNDATIDVYYDRLKTYTHSQISSAVTRLLDVWEKKNFPPIATIAANIKTGVGDQAKSPQSDTWVRAKRELRERAYKMVSEYIHKRLSGSIMSQARQEGWSGHLEAYVRVCAGYQAAIICGLLPSYQSILVFASYPPTYEQQKTFEENQKAACRGGEISVTIPQAMVEYWKKLAPQRSDMAPPSGHIANYVKIPA